MAENRGIKQAVLKAVKDAGGPVSARKVIVMTRAALPDTEVLDKSVRAMLTLASDAGVIHKGRLSNGRNVIYSARPLREKKVNGAKVGTCRVREVKTTDISETMSDITITVRLPSVVSPAAFVSQVEKALTMAIA